MLPARDTRQSHQCLCGWPLVSCLSCKVRLVSLFSNSSRGWDWCGMSEGLIMNHMFRLQTLDTPRGKNIPGTQRSLPVAKDIGQISLWVKLLLHSPHINPVPPFSLLCGILLPMLFLNAGSSCMDVLPGCFLRSQHDGCFLVRPLLTPGPVFLKV